MSTIMGILAAFGVMAIVFLAVVALASIGQAWERRKLRRWPDADEWISLRHLCEPGWSARPSDREAAHRAYQKLRARYEHRFYPWKR